MEGARSQNGMDYGLPVFITHGMASWIRHPRQKKAHVKASDLKTNLHHHEQRAEDLTVLFANLLDLKTI